MVVFPLPGYHEGGHIMTLCSFPAVPRYLALPGGDSYSVRLYDSLTIPFFLGSDPFLNLLRDDVEIALFDTTLGRPALVEPDAYRKLSPYRGEVLYNLSVSLLTGQYSLRVVIAGDIVASAELSIVVNCKLATHSCITGNHRYGVLSMQNF